MRSLLFKYRGGDNAHWISKNKMVATAVQWGLCGTNFRENIASLFLGSWANDYVKTMRGFWLHHSPCSLGCWTHNTLTIRSLSPKPLTCCERCHHRSCYYDVMKWHPLPRNWPFVMGIHRWPVRTGDRWGCPSLTKGLSSVLCWFCLILNKRWKRQWSCRNWRFHDARTYDNTVVSAGTILHANFGIRWYVSLAIVEYDFTDQTRWSQKTLPPPPPTPQKKITPPQKKKKNPPNATPIPG